MGKLKILILIDLTILLIITLIIVSRTTKINREAAQVKLEQAIKEVPMEQNTIDISTVKDKIKDSVNNSKIINEHSPQFPLYAVVDGYEFKVQEDGKVETVEEKNYNDNIDNIVEESNNINNITLENNNINNVSEGNNINIEVTQKEPLVKYQNETKIDKGITISTTEDGTVTITGKTTGKLFIKISNNIQISDNAKSFDIWKTEERSSFKKGDTN